MRALLFPVLLATLSGCTVFGDLTDYEIASADSSVSADGAVDTEVVDGYTPPTGCTRDEDCFGALGGANPPGCAEATCDKGSGTCKYKAKDLDGDKHAAAVCAVGSFAVELGDDCDEANAAIYPGAWDGPADGTHTASCDGVDNDCSKTPDDGKDDLGNVCACKAGATAECSELPDGTPITFPSGAPQGACKKGTRTCDDTGKWGACKDAVAPAAPDCSKPDDLDCDGAKDDTQLSDCTTTDGCAGKKCGASGTCNGGPSTTTWGVDKDNDGHCAGTTSFCAGKTPGAGYRDPTTCVGMTDDCDTNAAAWVNVSVRTDADGDTHCTGTASTVCTTGPAPSGKRLASSCSTVDDACDSSATAWVMVSVRTDTDGDTHCTGTATSVCTNGSAPSGQRLSTSCATPDDECEGNASGWYSLAIRTDADNDGHCVGGSTFCSTTTTAPAGSRLSSACTAPDDACDSTASGYVNVTVRTDADGDGHCTGSAYSACTTGSAPAGTKLSGSCTAGDDACDSNGSGWVNVTVRTDADGDGHCTGAAYVVCTGGSAPSGTRSSCTAGDDACDSNAGGWANVRTDADNDNYCVGGWYCGIPSSTAKTSCSGEDCKDNNGYAAVPDRGADGSQPCGYPYADSVSPSTWKLDGGGIGVSSGGSCNDCSTGGGTICNCRLFSGSCRAGYHLASCWTGVTSGSCSNWVNSTSGGRFFSGEVRLGIGAYGHCEGTISCDCAAD